MYRCCLVPSDFSEEARSPLKFLHDGLSSRSVRKRAFHGPRRARACCRDVRTVLVAEPAPRGRSFTHPHFPGFSRHFYPTREGVRKPHGLRWPPLEPAGTAKPPAIALASARPSYDTDL